MIKKIICKNYRWKAHKMRKRLRAQKIKNKQKEMDEKKPTVSVWKNLAKAVQIISK